MSLVFDTNSYNFVPMVSPMHSGTLFLQRSPRILKTHHYLLLCVTVLLQLSLMLKATSSFSTYSSNKGLCPADFNSTIIFKIILLLSVQFLLPMPQSVPPRSLLTQFPASPFQSLKPAIISICEEVFSSPLVSY